MYSLRCNIQVYSEPVYKYLGKDRSSRCVRPQSFSITNYAPFSVISSLCCSRTVSCESLMLLVIGPIHFNSSSIVFNQTLSLIIGLYNSSFQC